MILTSLLIYLGVKYHWGDHLKTVPDKSIELSIPDKKISNIQLENIVKNTSNPFDPEIEKNSTDNALLASMKKEQITEQCINLLSRDLTDSLTLELATVNCVVSNHQETFQNSQKMNNELAEEFKNKKLLFSQQCNEQYNKNSQYSQLEKQLLVGICVSDRLSNN